MHFFHESLRLNAQLLPIDFAKPWWKAVTGQKALVAAIALLTLTPHAFWSISPFLIAYVFTAKSLPVMLALFGGWLVVNLAETMGYRLNAKFQLQIIHSVHQSAHQHLLTIDPQYHIHRSSGAILGKIDRAARGYEDLLDQILLEFSPLVMGLITTVVVLGFYSLFLTAVVTILFALIILGGYWYASYFCQPWERIFIGTDDDFRSVAVENLAQIHLVRATFASDYISKKLTTKIDTNMRSEASLWLLYTYANLILRTLYLMAMFAVLLVLFTQIQAGTTTAISATAIAIAYLRNTQLLLRIVSPFRRYMRGFAAVKDLFHFIPSFGQQNYPVLGELLEPIERAPVIAVEARAISFDYKTARLFNEHTFSLRCPHDQPNKLYGIIGASGSGKTTLLSILGGQLKPNWGHVCINGVDIYSVNDSARQQLIALQGQVASTIAGTVKYNLLFGLPSAHGYSDDYLRDILQRVGLLTILATHQGLETKLGERGLNLSGGQRQRLNFASLYLRACFHQPSLILIDEPTSSLDEISEVAITTMIMELAQMSVTLVIAHRLKTVENAVGLIDLSLLQQEKNIVAYTATDLHARSIYYRQLVQGILQFDS